MSYARKTPSVPLNRWSVAAFVPVAKFVCRAETVLFTSSCSFVSRCARRLSLFSATFHEAQVNLAFALHFDKVC